MRESLGRLLRLYSRLLNKHKYTTQIVTGGVLWFSGDLLCQGLVQLGGGGEEGGDPSSRTLDNGHVTVPATVGRRLRERWRSMRIDWERTMRMSLYGVCCSAPVYAFWYGGLERYSQRLFAQQAPGSSLAPPTWLRRLSRWSMAAPLMSLLAGAEGAARLRTWKIIGFKLAMDTFLFDPLYLALFFSATGLMEGRRMGEIGQKLREDLATTWLVDMVVWTPIQTINFRYVPVLYQALVVQSCNIGWNAYLSFVQHRHH